MRKTKLNHRGFAHQIVPLLAVVALVGIVGGYFLVRGSHAATPGPIQTTGGTVEPDTANLPYCSKNGNYYQCLSDGGNTSWGRVLKSDYLFNGSPENIQL